MNDFTVLKSEEKEAIFKSNTQYKRVVVKESIDQNLFSSYGTGQIAAQDLEDHDAHRAISKKNIIDFFANNSISSWNTFQLIFEQYPSFLVKLLLLNGHYLFFDVMSTKNIDPNFNYAGLRFQYNSEVNRSPKNPARIRMRLRPNPLSANYFGIFFDAFPLRNDIVFINYEERQDLNGLWYVETGSEFVPSGNNQIQLSFRRYPRIARMQKLFHLDPFVFIGKFGELSGGKMFIQESPLYVDVANTQIVTPMTFKEQDPEPVVPVIKSDIQSDSDVISFFAPNSFVVLNFLLNKTLNSSATRIDVRMDLYTSDLIPGTLKKITNDISSDVDVRLLFYSEPGASDSGSNSSGNNNNVLFNETNTTSSNDVSCHVNYKDVENLMYLGYLRNDFPTQTTPFSYQLQYQRSIDGLEILSTDSGTRLRSVTLKPGSQIVFERLEFLDQNEFDGRSFISVCGFS